MTTTNDVLGRNEGDEVPDHDSTQTTPVGSSMLFDHDDATVTRNSKNDGEKSSLWNIEENSSNATNAVEDVSKNSGSSPGAHGKAPSNLLNSKQRAAKRGVAQKKNSYSPISKDTVESNDMTYMSPGAVPVQGTLSLPHDSIDALDNEQDDHSTNLEHDTENPHDLGPSLMVTARLVSENTLTPDFLEEQVERRIQEVVESRLRAKQDEEHSAPPQYPTITTVVAEPLVLTDAISEGHNNQNPANPSATSTRKICGLRPILLLGFSAMFVVGAVFGVIVDPTSNEATMPNPQLLEMLKPWVVRSDSSSGDEALFEDASSPQARGLDWLSQSDVGINFPDSGPIAVVLEPYVLAVLYYSTDGPNWVKEDYDFLSNTTNVCSWNNNKSWDDFSARGIICGNNSNVEHILLDQESLSGTIPWELSLLSDLLSLTLSDNNLRWSIPTELGQLTLLQKFDVSSNELEGTLPTEIGNFTDLTEFGIAHNLLNGSLPNEVEQMTSLTHIHVSSNFFTGTLPTELGRLRSLQYFWAESNKFQGTLPIEFSALTAMKGFTVHGNDLQGTIPVEWSQMTRLQDFRLSSNTLTGTIPPELGQLVNLSILSVEDNILTGTVPTELGQLLKIQNLFVNINKLNGTVPTELSLLTGLLMLWLNDNSLVGTIMTELGNLSALTSLGLAGNNFTGTIPTELGRLTDLLNLRLDDNELMGTLPTELGQLISLSALFINMNNVGGTIPTAFSLLTNLLVLWVDDNALTGTLPTELGNLTSLTSMNLALNAFTGTLPTELGQLVDLSNLYINMNKLNGTLPSELGRWTGLSVLWVHENSLAGVLPAELGRLTMLEAFHAERNGFTGSVPIGLSELSSLTNFWFHQNDLTGSVNDILCTDGKEWQTLQSDCLATNGETEIECACCTICCNSGGANCQTMT